MKRRALITGGEGDLAQAIAGELASADYKVDAPGRQALDVTSSESVAAWFAEREAYDLVIHNAGFTEDALLVRMDAASFARVLDVHLTGAFRIAREALRPMAKRRSGHFIWIGSHSALTGPVGQANYAAAKAGLVGLGKSLAREFGSRNIRVNGVLPGFLETRMTAHLLADPNHHSRILADHSLGRLNTPADTARFIAHLDTLEHVSGQVFSLDSRV